MASADQIFVASSQQFGHPSPLSDAGTTLDGQFGGPYLSITQRGFQAACSYNRPSDHDRHARAAPSTRARTISASRPTGSSPDPVPWRVCPPIARSASLIIHVRIPRMPLSRHGHWVGAALATAVLLGAAAAEVRGQEAVLRGKVTDERGDPLPVATVQVVELNIGVFTNAEGIYAITI